MDYARGLQLYQYLLSKGVPSNTAAGFVGSFGQESSFNPEAFNRNDAGPGKHSYGWGQWNRDRFANLQSAAASLKTDWRDPRAQLRHIDNELSGPYSGVLNLLRSGNSVDLGVQAGIRYENPAKDARSQAIANRTRYGYDILKRASGVTAQPIGGPPPTSLQYDPLSSFGPSGAGPGAGPGSELARSSPFKQIASHLFNPGGGPQPGLSAGTPMASPVTAPAPRKPGLLGALASLGSSLAEPPPQVQAPPFQGLGQPRGDVSIPQFEYPQVQLPTWGGGQQQASPEDQRMRQLLAMLGRG